MQLLASSSASPNPAWPLASPAGLSLFLLHYVKVTGHIAPSLDLGTVAGPRLSTAPLGIPACA